MLITAKFCLSSEEKSNINRATVKEISVDYNLYELEAHISEEKYSKIMEHCKEIDGKIILPIERHYNVIDEKKVPKLEVKLKHWEFIPTIDQLIESVIEANRKNEPQLKRYKLLSRRKR